MVYLALVWARQLRWWLGSPLEFLIFRAGRDKGGRCRWRQPLFLVAHAEQLVGEWATVADLFEARVLAVFPRPFARLQELEPGLDVPLRHGDDDRIVVGPQWHLAATALSVQPSHSFRRGSRIRVDHDQKPRALTSTNRPELFRKLRTHPLFAGLLAMRKGRGVDVAALDVPMRQKTSDETLGLAILAEQDEATAHSFQPREIISESESPSTICSG